MRGNGSPTLNDVAKQAGVALDTARRALDGNPSVRSYLRQKVEEAAAALGYRPNLVARALKEQSLWVVPISVIDLSTPYFGEMALHLSAELTAQKLEPVLCVDPAHLQTMSRTVSARGCILVNGLDEQTVEESARQMAVVTINSTLHEMPGVCDVATDYLSVYRELCSLLVAEGRRRAALFSPLQEAVLRNGWVNPKMAAIVQTCREAGLEICGGDEDVCATLPQTMALMNQNKRPDAIFCENDLIAGKIYAHLMQAGLRVPQDVRLIGCDGNYLLPGLWTLDLNTSLLARRAVTGLVRIYNKQPGAFREWVVPQILCETDSEVGNLRVCGRTDRKESPALGHRVGLD